MKFVLEINCDNDIFTNDPNNIRSIIVDILYSIIKMVRKDKELKRVVIRDSKKTLLASYYFEELT
jgi:hypothetical protein